MDRKEQIKKYLELALYNYDLPGLAVAADIEEEGKEAFTFTGTFGYSDYPLKKPLSPDNIFHMASVSKILTGLSVIKLVRMGEIGLDDDIREYLVYLPYENVTIRKMLSHTGGLADVKSYEWNQPMVSPYALEEFAHSNEVARAQKLEEGKFSYSNIAYELLGAMIEKVAGMTYDKFVEENIFLEAGMKDSNMLTFERSDLGRKLDPKRAKMKERLEALSVEALWQGGLVTPHVKDKDNKIVRVEHFPYNRKHGPSSTLTSNLHDMRKLADWLMALLDGDEDNKKLIMQMWERQAIVPNNGEEMGLAWFMRDQGPYKLYGHEGTDDGFRASFWICPQIRAHITVVSNISRAPVKKINKKILDIMLA